MLFAVAGLHLFLRAFRHNPADDKISRDFSQMALTAVGGIASLILGFTMFTSMSAFSAASNLVAEEASSIGGVQEATVGLDASDKATITQALFKYANIVIDQEWVDQMDGLPVFSFPGNAVRIDLQQTIATLNTVFALCVFASMPLTASFRIRSLNSTMLFIFGTYSAAS